MSVFTTPISGLTGGDNVLSALAGKVVLVVNVASKCGLTPQYTQLEKMHEDLAVKGFSVVGVPCNQFGGQEPGSASDIATFCSTNYGVTFPMTEKVDVNGPGRHPLYDPLVKTADAEGHSGDIRWNFEKFLVARDGRVVARFSPMTAPDAPDIVAAIDRELAAR
jgi:glutathione peroxidase